MPKVLVQEQVLHSSKSISELVNETGDRGCILAVNKNNNVHLVDMIPKGVTVGFFFIVLNLLVQIESWAEDSSVVIIIYQPDEETVQPSNKILHGFLLLRFQEF